MIRHKGSRNWCFTLNTPLDTDLEDLLSLVGSRCITYMIVGVEKGDETSRTHLQGYVHLSKGLSFDSVKKMLGERLHIEPCRGSPESNIAYCSKQGEWSEQGERPRQKGSRCDLDKVRDMVDDHVPMDVIVSSCRSFQSVRYAETLLKYQKLRTRGKPRVVWLYGKTGVGKTRRAYEMFSGEYWVSSNDLTWFDGYYGQPNVLIDDFRASMCKFAFLLRLLDRYPLRVPVKGGFVSWNPVNIVVTSTSLPQDCYESEKIREDIGQLLRRIDEIVEVRDTSVDCTPATL